MSNKKELDLEELENVNGGVYCDEAPYWMRSSEVVYKHQLNEEVELEIDYFVVKGSTRCKINNRGVGIVDKGYVGARAYVPIYWLETLNRERAIYDGWYPEKCFKEGYTNKVLPVSQELY